MERCMMKYSLRMAAFYSFLFFSPYLLAETAGDEFVKSFFSDFYFTPLTETSSPSVGNFRKYSVQFDDPTIPPERGYVDIDGQYFIKGAKIITNPHLIHFYLENSEPLGEFFDIFNLEAAVISEWLLKIDIVKTQDHAIEEEKKNSPSKRLVYIDKNRQYVVIGKAIITNRSFTNELFLQAHQSIRKDTARQVAEGRKELAGFWLGDARAPRNLFVIAEPNCQACHQLYDQLKPYIDSKELLVYWALVAFVQPDSRGKVLAILDGQVPPDSFYPNTPQGAWAYHVDNSVFTEEDRIIGGIPPSTQPSFQAISQLNKNTQFLLSSIDIITPFLIFKNADTQWEYRRGEILNTQKFIDKIFNKKLHHHSAKRSLEISIQ